MEKSLPHDLRGRISLCLTATIKLGGVWLIKQPPMFVLIFLMDIWIKFWKLIALFAPYGCKYWSFYLAWNLGWWFPRSRSWRFLLKYISLKVYSISIFFSCIFFSISLYCFLVFLSQVLAANSPQTHHLHPLQPLNHLHNPQSSFHILPTPAGHYLTLIPCIPSS